MNKYVISTIAIGFLYGFFSNTAFAAPSLPVNKPPVVPLPSWTGPPNDPHAIEGQWFYEYASGINSRRTHEFHDNFNPFFGGGFASYKAVFGRVANLLYDPNPPNNLISFDIIATISNDVPALSPWFPGTNNHSESSVTLDQHANTLYGARLAIEFAISDLTNIPPVWLAPQFDLQPYIIALNEDLLAWYCWTPDNEENLTPFGNYYIPAWEFGDIPPGAGVTRTLHFTISLPGMDGADFRRGSLELSENSFIDVLFNRSTSLKISHWLAVIPIETGEMYPEFPTHSSNCSVFHNIPEPAFILFLPILLTVMPYIRKRNIL